jgi:hypothetical protein
LDIDSIKGERGKRGYKGDAKCRLRVGGSFEKTEEHASIMLARELYNTNKAMANRFLQQAQGPYFCGESQQFSGRFLV